MQVIKVRVHKMRGVVDVTLVVLQLTLHMHVWV